MAENMIIGIGNPILSDDGIGPKIVWELKKNLDPNNFQFHTDYLLSLEILPKIKGFKNLFFIDGCRTKRSNPGELSFFTINNYSHTLHLNNYHDIELKHLIDLSHQINNNPPVNINIIGIEILEDKLFSEKLSDPLRESFDLIILQTTGYIEQVLEFNYNTKENEKV